MRANELMRAIGVQALGVPKFVDAIVAYDGPHPFIIVITRQEEQPLLISNKYYYDHGEAPFPGGYFVFDFEMPDEIEVQIEKIVR